MTMNDPTGMPPVGPTRSGYQAWGCFWWWWIAFIILIIFWFGGWGWGPYGGYWFRRRALPPERVVPSQQVIPPATRGAILTPARKDRFDGTLGWASPVNVIGNSALALNCQVQRCQLDTHSVAWIDIHV